ncbi:MAG TPA: cytochrome c oxidase subunit II [Verrucomicrobiae bacterium]|jgi:cytochrome c oxidase subunit 2|nr:cytochrome c oxidase subunit II [Verrucomicrobiae bacterium]
MNFPLFPPQASQVARQTDHLLIGLILFSAFAMVVVFVPMIYFLFKYRRGTKADRRPVHLPEIMIEATWTIIPTIVFAGLFAWGANVYWAIERPPADAMDISVVGKQWMWKIEHPEGNREIDELHVPLGRNIKLTLASQDVIHSFFLPAFRVKQDVVPGRYSTLWFKADKLGTFHLFCSEYCGTHHSAMVGSVFVMTPDAYQRWLMRGAPGSTMAQEGERLFRAYGCSGCHIQSTIVRAPPLEGLYGRAVPLQSGQIVTADDGYLRDSILLPAKDIAAGYTNDMPSFQGHLSEDDLMKLIAYIKSISDTTPTRETEEAK